MKGLTFSLLFVLIAVAGFLRSSATKEQTKQVASLGTTQTTGIRKERYLVTHVIDGDTIQIEGGEKVRYIGIDTPETVHPSKAIQCFGKEASRYNSELVMGKLVTLVKDISDTDKYGRLLRYVYIGDEFVNLTLVQNGYAYATSFPPDIAHAANFRRAENTAREAKKGLWSSCPAR